MTDVLVLASGLLAQRDSGPEFGKASPFGLLVIVVLLVATFLLVWSMNRHLKRLPESFDPEHPEPDQAADDGTVELGSGEFGSAEPGSDTRRQEPPG